MRPAIIGIIEASESSAITDLSDRIERRLSAVGNVFGNNREKKMIRARVSSGNPYTVRRRLNAAAGDILLSSERVGSSALDFSDSIARLHSASVCSARLAEAAASRLATDSASAPSSAATRPWLKTSARWQTLAISSKSVDTMMIAA